MHDVPVTWLEFISSLKWPIVVLAAIAWLARATKTNPGFGKWLKDWIDKRNLNAELPGMKISTSDAQQAVQTATAPDGDLPEGRAQEIRQEAVEQLMRQASILGWIAHMNNESPPSPTIQQVEGQTVIDFARTITAEQRAALLRRVWAERGRIRSGAADT